MKAAFLDKSKRIYTEEIVLPDLDSDQVLVQVESVGICGSDEGNADHADDASFWMGHAGGSCI